jgi:hypothetical protein
VAKLFARYEKQLEMTLETVFGEVSQRRSKALADAKVEVTGARGQGQLQESLKVKVPL